MTFALSVLGLWACVSQQDDTPGSMVQETGSPAAEDSADPPDPVEEIDGASLPQGSNPCRGPVLGTVSEIIDGDTIKVETGRGVERVRLIGINTPEVDHSGPDDECYGEEAKAYLTAMIDGKRAWLTFDEECADQYGRTLAYVHRGTEESSFVQRMLLLGGWATAYAVRPNTSFEDAFESDESLARSTGEGIWGSCR